MKKIFLINAFCALSGAAILANAAGTNDPSPAARQSAVRETENALSRAVSYDRKTAREIDAILAAEENVLAENRNMRLQIPVLELEERRLKRRIASLKEKTARLEDEVKRYSEIALFIENDLYDASDEMNARAQAGLPFLVKERSERAAFIEKSVNDPSILTGEKLRRLLEAMNVEADYGSSVETSTGEALLDGKKTTLTLLRVGRIGYFALTLDKKTAGAWADAETGFKSDDDLLEPLIILADTIDSRTKTKMALVPVGLKEEN